MGNFYQLDLMSGLNKTYNTPREYRKTYVTKVEQVIDIINYAKVNKKEIKGDNVLYVGINAQFDEKPIVEELNTNYQINRDHIHRMLLDRQYDDGRCVIENRTHGLLCIFNGYTCHDESWHSIFSIVEGREKDFMDKVCIMLFNPIKTTHKIIYKNFIEKPLISIGSRDIFELFDDNSTHSTGSNYLMSKQDVREGCYFLDPSVFNFLYKN